MIGFGTALEDAGFATSGAPGEEVGGAEFEHGCGGVRTSTGTTLGGDGVLPVAHGVERTFAAALARAELNAAGAWWAGVKGSKEEYFAFMEETANGRESVHL